MRKVFLFFLIGSATSSAPAQTVLSACVQPGAEVGAQINAAVKKLVLGGSGGIVDGTCYSGNVSVASNMLAGVSTSLPITVKLGPALFAFAPTGAQQIITANNFTLEGTELYGTTIQFSDPTNDVFVIPNSGGGANVAIQNLVIQQATNSNKTAGNVFNVQGQRDSIQNIQLIDPYNGFYVYNAFDDTFRNISFYTTRSGTLNYGLYLYGTDIDDFFYDIYGNTNFPISDSFLHIRNRVTGVRFSNFAFQANAQNSTGSGILLDCGSSPTVNAGCTDSYSASPLNRPELLHFDKVYVEAGASGNAVTIQGGQDVRFSDSYFASSLTGFTISGPSTAISIDNSFLVNMQHQCIYVATGDIIPGYANLSIQGNEINACSQASNQTYAAVELAANINDVGIVNNHIGHNTFTNLSYDSPFAVKLDGAHNNVRIIGNDFVSIGGGGSSFYTGSPINGGSSVNDVWLNNTGFSIIQTTAGSFASVASQQGFSVNGSGGFTGTKQIGSCTLVIQGGIITNVSGC